VSGAERTSARRARRTGIAFGGAALLGVAVACAAAERVALTGAQAAPDLGFPSVARVVLGFAFTAGLAVAVAWAIRRWGPTFSARRAVTGQSIRTLERTVVSATLKVYLLEIDGTRFIVAESRSGVAVTAADPQPGTPAEARP
jgi:hypothetical protein